MYDSIPQAISIEKARALIAANMRPGRIETVSLADAVGRVVARDCTSDIDVAPFDDSAMDGFAVRATDIENASADYPIDLQCVAHIGAGSHYEGTLAAGECVRIMTGAPVPNGADAIIKIEDARCEGNGSVGDAIGFSSPSAPGQNIRRAGEEAKAGEVVIRAGDLIEPAGVGLLASCGNVDIPVYARPRVAIITTGSELVDSHEIPGPGMIRDSNRWAISAYVLDAGGIPVRYPRVADDLDSITALFKQAVEECDIVVSTGGACMGDFDLTPHVLGKLGQILFTRVSMKPGKSQPFGLIDGKPVFVLSGNPGASSVGFEMFARPALRLWQGYSNIDRPRVPARIDSDVRKKEPRVFLQRGTVSRNVDDMLVASQYGNQSSGLFGSLQRANCLIVIPEGLEGVRAGDTVECILTHVSEEFALQPLETAPPAPPSSWRPTICQRGA